MTKVTANQKTVEIGGVEVEYGTQGEMFIDVSLGLDKSMRLALADYVHESLIDMGKDWIRLDEDASCRLSGGPPVKVVWVLLLVTGYGVDSDSTPNPSAATIL